MTTEGITPNLPGQHTQPIAAGLILDIITAFAMAHAANAGGIELETQRSLSFARSTLLTQPEMAEARRRGTWTPEQYHTTLERAGYTDNGIAALETLIPALLDAGSIQELRRRGQIDDAIYARSLKLLGYDDEQIQYLASLRLYIPSAQDVVSFANRDVYYPDVVKDYGMDQDFPEAMIPDMERAGLSRDTALKYWEAHWTLPSMPLAFEMLQRDAETGLTPRDINRLMRSAGIEPYWRDKILAVSYSPYTRVDIRRMHKLGILKEPEVTRAYQDIGYNKDRAEKLTAFTVALNGTLEHDELQPFRNKFRTHAESLFLDGLIDEVELHAQFLLLGYTQAEADAYVAESSFVLLAAARKETRTAIRKAYEAGHISADSATERLKADGLSDAVVARAMSTWHIARELRELSVHEHAERDLSKSDIITAYIDDLIKTDEATKMLVALKYDEHEAALYIGMADVRKLKASRTAAEHVQHSLFIARRVTRDEASKGLAEAHIDPARIASLLLLWQQELDARTPTLTKAEVAHAVAQAFITEAEGMKRLAAMGYAHADITIIIELASKGVIVV